MKTILMSIQPKWCELIASGKKIVEVRKTRPKLETPFKVYIYCTQTKTMGDFILCKSFKNVKLFGFNTAKGINKGFAEKEDIQLKGKVIGEFVCDGIIKIGNYQEADYSYMLWVKDRETTERLCKDACLNEFAIQDYLGQNGGFGWRISNLVIYNEPKELSEYGLSRPPQSWCYIKDHLTKQEINSL